MTVTSSRSTSAERPRPQPLRRWAALALATLSLAPAGCVSASSQAANPQTPAGRRPAARRAHGGRGRDGAARAAAADPGPVSERVLRFVDHTRTLRYPHHAPQPRPLVTVIRFPTGARGPLPLIVFGHGFAETPGTYWRLLRAWTLAGYVVAAPVFPLENRDAPGGPDESDLINQPRDISFVITRLLALSSATGDFLSGRIDPNEIAVSGQSDGGETALATAYDRYFLDRRVRAAAILSGAQIPHSGLYFPPGSPPLLATQGTADTINRPHYTYDFFAAARRPKYLLKLIGAPHLPPYTSEEPQLTIVSRVTTAFFDLYLKHEPGALGRMRAAGARAGLAALTVAP